MPRALLVVALSLALGSSAPAAFNISGNPTAYPGWYQAGNSLKNGSYVRGAGNFEYDIWQFQGGRVPAGSILTTMPNPWQSGDRVIGMGGFFKAPYSASELGWPALTGGAQNALVGPNARFVAKFGVDSGSGGNLFSPSTVAPASGNGIGSFAPIGNGGLGSILVSIAGNRFTPANAGALIMPTIATGGPVTGPDDVAQFDGLFGPTPGHGGNGLDLFNAGANGFPSARYIFQTNPSTGFLSSWEVLLDIDEVNRYPGALQSTPRGSGNWIMTIQAGSGPSTDGLITSAPLFDTPAPPAFVFAAFGGLGLFSLRRRMK